MRNIRSVNPYFSESESLASGKMGMKTSDGSGVRITSSATKGTRNITNKEARAIRSQTLVTMAKRTGIFELFWYPTFIIGGLLCLILIRPINLELILCVMQLWMAMVANNLAARGKRIGLLINTVSMAMYVYVSICNQVWGEVIINLCMYIPLEIIGFVKWKQASEGNSSNLLVINRLKGVQYLYLALIILGGVGSIFSLLHFGLRQDWAIFNAISIATGIIGNVMRNKRYLEVWAIWIICNLAGIALWAMQAFAGGAGELSLSVLPLVLSYTSTLTNDFNGWAIWNAMYRKQNQADRVYLARRKVSVNKIAKLKQQYRTFTCNETSDVAGENFRKR